MKFLHIRLMSQLPNWKINSQMFRIDCWQNAMTLSTFQESSVPNTVSKLWNRLSEMALQRFGSISNDSAKEIISYCSLEDIIIGFSKMVKKVKIDADQLRQVCACVCMCVYNHHGGFSISNIFMNLCIYQCIYMFIYASNRQHLHTKQ